MELGVIHPMLHPCQVGRTTASAEEDPISDGSLIKSEAYSYCRAPGSHLPLWHPPGQPGSNCRTGEVHLSKPQWKEP